MLSEHDNSIRALYYLHNQNVGIGIDDIGATLTCDRHSSVAHLDSLSSRAH